MAGLPGGWWKKSNERVKNLANFLFIAFDFPPILSPESVQIQRRALVLARAGHSVTVLTSHENPKFETLDPALSIKHPNLRLLRTKKPAFETLQNAVGKFLQIADRKVWWIPLAARAASKLLTTEKFDAFYTHSTPLASHLVGLKIKKYFPHLRWIAHFSDPWTQNSYIRYQFAWQENANKRLEEKVLRAADRLSVTSEKTRQLFIDRYPFLTNKSAVLPHLFDPAAYCKTAKNPSEKIILVHTGHIYGLRTAAALFHTLCANPLPALEIHLYGRIHEHEARMITELGLQKQVFIHPTVSYGESLAAMANADALLVIDAPLENSPFFPSKLADYLGAKKPIIALTPSDSTTADILRSCGQQNHIAHSNDKTAIGMVLARLDKAAVPCHLEPYNMDFSASALLKVFQNDR